MKDFLYISILLVIFFIIIFKYFSKYKKTIFILALPALLFLKLCEGLVRNELLVFDKVIYDFFSLFISDNITRFMIAVTYMGSAYILISLAVFILLLLRKNKTYSIYGRLSAVNLTATWIANELFKMIFQRTRPDILRLVEVHGFSFPSGHSMISLSFYGLLIYFIYRSFSDKRKKYLLIFLLSLLIIFIGMSRVYLGVHYASDVLAGFSVGFVWLIIIITFINKYFLPKS